ncbi:DNA repair protein, partial [Fusobacterium mortiferum]|nr:DNA repair protein [Fusobacterium mortiferum]
AFILASTTNPKEYIQRRGRVLRKSKNLEKEFAEIYDFVTLPRPLETVQYLTLKQLKLEIPLVKKEILRMEEFCHLAMNPSTTRKIINEIKDSYKDNIKYFEEEEE